jgi:hypothetical protein
LVGLFSVVTAVAQLCAFHNIISRGVTVGCDNISTVTLVFNSDYYLSISLSGHNSLFATQGALENYPIQWTPQHMPSKQ